MTKPNNPPAGEVMQEAMTLRDYFAGKALIGRTTRAYYRLESKGFEESLAKQCYAIADAMLLEREKET